MNKETILEKYSRSRERVFVLDDEIHDAIKRFSKAEGRTYSGFIASLVKERMRKEVEEHAQS